MINLTDAGLYVGKSVDGATPTYFKKADLGKWYVKDGALTIQNLAVIVTTGLQFEGVTTSSLAGITTAMKTLFPKANGGSGGTAYNGGPVANDVEITDSTKGVVLCHPDGTKIRLTVVKDGGGNYSLTTNVIP